jgi:hypothetical protein
VEFDPKQKKQLFSLRKWPCNRVVRGHCTYKEMLVILVKKVVDKYRWKKEDRRGGEAQGVADKKTLLIQYRLHFAN